MGCVIQVNKKTIWDNIELILLGVRLTKHINYLTKVINVLKSELSW